MFSEFLKKIGEEIGAAIGLVIASLIGYGVTVVKEMYKARKLKKREKFEKEFRNDRMIGELLVEVRNDFHANCISLFQVENETLKADGHPTKITVETLKMTYEKPKGHFVGWMADAQRILISEYPQTEEKMKLLPFVPIQDHDNNTEEENRLLRLIVKQEIKGFILVLIPSEKKTALGALWLSYIDNLYEPTETDLIMLKKYVKQLSYLLSDYV